MHDPDTNPLKTSTSKQLLQTLFHGYFQPFVELRVYDEYESWSGEQVGKLGMRENCSGFQREKKICVLPLG